MIKIEQLVSKEQLEIFNELFNEEEGACASPPLNTNEKIDSFNPDAPEFVPKNATPKQRSYAEAVSPENMDENNANETLCPYANKDGICRNLTDCTYLHGELCDLCSRLILHPYNEDQRKRHRQVRNLRFRE